MAVKIKKGDALAFLNLTPLIDMVFLLLIFFLVATRFEEEDRELAISLPSATEAKPLVVQPRELELNIDQQGNYFLEGQPMPAGELEETLASQAVNNPVHQSVRIRADRRCPWDYVATAINLCHVAGIRDVRPVTSGPFLDTPGARR